MKRCIRFRNRYFYKVHICAIIHVFIVQDYIILVYLVHAWICLIEQAIHIMLVMLRVFDNIFGCCPNCLLHQMVLWELGRGYRSRWLCNNPRFFSFRCDIDVSFSLFGTPLSSDSRSESSSEPEWYPSPLFARISYMITWLSAHHRYSLSNAGWWNS